MGRWAQKHRDTLTLEERRLKGGRLLRKGVPPAEVARRLAVTPQAALRPRGAGMMGRSRRLAPTSSHGEGWGDGVRGSRRLWSGGVIVKYA